MSDYYLVIKNMQTMRDFSMAAGKAILERGENIACAESCTGGLLSSLLTDVAGSSAYVQGGVVAYSNEVKEKLLKEGLFDGKVCGKKAQHGAHIGVDHSGSLAHTA